MTSMMLDPDRLLGVREDRRDFSLHECEVRADGPHDVLATGYASLFEDPYDVFGGPKGKGWTEIVDRGAFHRSLGLNPDVVFVLNHDRAGVPLARTTAGTLKLAADSKGLHSEARMDRRDPLAQSIEVALERGHLNEMSFAFRTVRQSWNGAGTERRLLEVNLDKGDVSLVTHGSNPRTRMGLAGALEALSEVTGLELRGQFEDPRTVLTEARSQIERLLTELSPRSPTRMTLAEAMRVVDGLA